MSPPTMGDSNLPKTPGDSETRTPPRGLASKRKGNIRSPLQDTASKRSRSTGSLRSQASSSGAHPIPTTNSHHKSTLGGITNRPPSATPYRGTARPGQRQGIGSAAVSTLNRTAITSRAANPARPSQRKNISSIAISTPSRAAKPIRAANQTQTVNSTRPNQKDNISNIAISTPSPSVIPSRAVNPTQVANPTPIPACLASLVRLETPARAIAPIQSSTITQASTSSQVSHRSAFKVKSSAAVTPRSEHSKHRRDSTNAVPASGRDQRGISRGAIPNFRLIDAITAPPRHNGSDTTPSQSRRNRSRTPPSPRARFEAAGTHLEEMLSTHRTISIPTTASPAIEYPPPVESTIRPTLQGHFLFISSRHLLATKENANTLYSKLPRTVIAVHFDATGHFIIFTKGLDEIGSKKVYDSCNGQSMDFQGVKVVLRMKRDYN